jgi:hypothetical protein
LAAVPYYVLFGVLKLPTIIPCASQYLMAWRGVKIIV